MKNKNYSESTKEIQQPQIATETPTLILTKIKYFLFALLLALSFYGFNFIKPFNENFYAAKENYNKVNNLNKKALKKIKDAVKGKEVYLNYLKVNSAKKAELKKYKSIVKSQEVLGFKSFHFFIERLGLFLGVFLYALYNLFRSFYFDRKNTGVKIIHGFIISVCMFYFFWIFQQFQDFNKATYYLMTIISAVVVVFAVHLITKYQDHRINRLKKGQFELAKFTFKNTKPEKREEMLDTIERVVKDH